MKKILYVFTIIIMVFMVTSCNENNDTDQVAKVKEELSLPSQVSDDLNLPNHLEGYDVLITWSSDNTDVISHTGDYTQPLLPTTVVLTATLELGEVTDTKIFSITAAGYSNQQLVDTAKSELTLDVTEVDEDFTLVTQGSNDTNIEWSSDKAEITISDGSAIVNRPMLGEDNVVVVLTATITKGEASATKTFNVEVLAYELDSITFIEPTKLLYVEGENLDVTGGKFILTLDDTSTKEISLTNDMITGFDSSQAGTIELTASYLENDFKFNVEIEKEVNPVVNKEISIGESIVESFDDRYNPQLGFDFSKTPNSEITDDENKTINGRSLYMESEGSFKTIFIHEGITYTPNGTYRISFDYKLISLIDTIYFQLTDGANSTIYKQFGLQSEIGIVKQFEFEFQIEDSSDYLIQIFPGAGVGTTSLIIDNFKIERIERPTTIVTDELNVGDSYTETFGDSDEQIFNIDTAQVPNSSITTDTDKVIDGKSLYLESDGSYHCVFLDNTFTYTPNATYRIIFDYKVISLVDTIYFQLNGGTEGNLFDEFGSQDSIGEVKQFSGTYTLGNTSDYIIQIFPGGGQGTTAVIIDNVKIERIEVEENKTVSGEIEIGDYVHENFGDSNNPVFTLDNESAPNSTITDIEGNNVLYFESDGNFSGIYLLNTFSYTANAIYRITFDYKVTSIMDTVYFQLTGDGDNVFAQFGSPDTLNQSIQFDETFTLGDSANYMIQIFPGASQGTTSLYIDNIKVERIEVEENKTVSGEIEIGDYVYESFGDSNDPVFTLDNAPAPNSTITDIEGNNALYFESDGNFSGIYLLNTFSYTANAIYRITFDYKVTSIMDTVYFQLTGDGGNVFAQFGSPDTLNQSIHFDETLTIGNSSNYMIQIFPGATEGITSVILDNLTFERVS